MATITARGWTRRHEKDAQRIHIPDPATLISFHLVSKAIVPIQVPERHHASSVPSLTHQRNTIPNSQSFSSRPRFSSLRSLCPWIGPNRSPGHRSKHIIRPVPLFPDWGHLHLHLQLPSVNIINLPPLLPSRIIETDLGKSLFPSIVGLARQPFSNEPSTSLESLGTGGTSSPLRPIRLPGEIRSLWPCAKSSWLNRGLVSCDAPSSSGRWTEER